MKRSQLIGIGIASVAGLVAFMGMRILVNQKPKTVVNEKVIGTVDVLVARAELKHRDTATSAHLAWKKWPKNAVSEGYITRTSMPKAVQKMQGAVALSYILPNEPITTEKLRHPGDRSVLSVLLREGMRAIATKINDATAAGRLILPNDYVDVILTVRNRKNKDGAQYVSTTLFHNVRVLAIGKKLNVENKQGGADGPVATLELTPIQAQKLAQANSMGEISLALRSILDKEVPEEAVEFGVRVFKGASIFDQSIN